MENNNYYHNLINQVARRSVESTISVLGISDKGLRKHLANEMGADIESLGLLSDPVFESMFPWEKSLNAMEALSGNMLRPSLIKAMDEAGDQKFGKDWFPFKHQIESWTVLQSDPNKSLVVTSGTGSGKTECFMVPILNDLAREYEENYQPLIGVRALFIYPLNALINSQRERLRAWTEAYDDGLRFCLYNGNTEENKHKDMGKYPNEILTRKVLRDSPAPMLVTNATMLEYMLVRQVDEPIIQQSKGLLRWIVLDEAHSYMGSQAAELSLLLRRVLHAFGVEAGNVRFVATSATIGDSGADKKLQQFLASLAGVSEEQVVVVGGERSVPSLPKLVPQKKELNEILEIDSASRVSAERFRALTLNSTAVKLRSLLTNSKTPSTLNSLTNELFGDKSRFRDTLNWIDICSSTSGPGPNKKSPLIDAEPFLPVRGHLFHQVLSSLWCCADKNCSAKENTPLLKSWPFGRVYSERKNTCQCGAPIYELVFCNDCNAPHLIGLDKNGILIQRGQEAVDEFSLDFEAPDENEAEDVMPEFSDNLLVAPKLHPQMTYAVSIDSERRITSPGMDTYDLNVLQPDDMGCAKCEHRGFKSPFYRRSILGTPFYISNTIPTLLDACQESDQANERPNRGRRLITFTDSRQGTARISTKIQQDSERDSIRGLIYGVTAQNVSALSKVEQKALEDKLEEYQYKAEKFRGHGELDLVKSIDELAEPIRQQLNSVGSAKLLHWNAALNNLYSSPDISRWIFDYYKKLNPVLFPDNGGARILTEMLLLREFARRPKRQNSMETLGLVAVRYPALSEIKRAPVVWLELGLDLPEWVAYLKVILDFFIRENSIINIPIDWVDWMGAKIYPKSVLGPNSDESTSSRIKAWPKINRGRNGRIVRMLVVACDLELENKVHRDSVTGVLKEAWIALTAKYQVKDDETNQTEIRQILKSLPGTVQFHLDRAEMSFGACACGWVCPITNRLVDSTFKGITPYLPYNLSEQKIICRKVTIPIYQINASEFESDLARKIAIRDWVSEQAEISELRSENLWTDISDKILEGGKFFRTAEHSAQQPASKLERYEAMFKVGKLNVLNCSTTMEMGVDIGGISVVAMNNVPPHPANYLQRSGRAGRRGETQALSFTICKDNPHERQVFVNPLWPFTTSIDAPYITLNSERIVQRHVNSLFLAYFLKEILTVNEKSLTSLNCQWFFYHDDISQAPVERFERWLASLSHEYIPVNLKEGIERIVKGSVLSSLSIVQIISRSIDSVDVAKNQWLPGYRKLKDELSKASSLKESDPFRRKVEYDLKCMGEGYLLSELASKAFLPGYGFPTGIATFDHFSVDDYKRGKYRKASGRIDNLTRMRERPGRDMAVAIREYAPGADVVLDGLVYRSAGILLNKFSPSEDYSVPQKMTVEWRCDSCGFIGNESGATFSNHCSECGASLSEDHVKDYLEPIGFAVDFYSSPSTDISSQMYVPTQEPWVTANDTLNPLFDPRLGSYRNSPKGHIFNHSSGAFGNGFAVCLRCGKADSMTNDNEYPFGLQPGKPHKKLQGKPGPEETAMCEGPEEAYAIKSGVHLGSTDQTDVYELYLKYPEENLYIRHQKGDSLPWTLAVVLRQVLADIHGIDASEMGYTIKPSRLQGCGYPVATIVLFDKCGGGAGFSTAAPRYLRDMFIRALAYLECAEDCDSACQSCLMGYDTRFHIDLLNRHSAIKYIETILPFLDLPLNAKLFGEDSKYCNEPLSSEIIASSTSGHTQLRIFTGASYADWNINNGSMKESCLSWRNMFDEVELVLPGNHVNELSDIHKEDLKALSNFGIKLTVLSGGVSLPSSTGCLLAQVIIGKKVISYAWTQSSINIPDSNWWDFEEGYLVKSDSFQEVGVVEFDEKHLSTVKGDGDIEIDLSSQCDGLINQFGEKFWDHISEKSETLLTIFNSDLSLQKLEYSDCYICTPWSLMLLAEIIDGLKQRLEGKWSHPEIALNTSEKNNPRKGSGVYGEWASKQDTGTVIAHYFEQMDEQINVNLKPFKDIPHGRILSLYWGNGSTSTIRLDHGVGCWSMDGHASKWLDVQGSAESQVSDMFDLLPSIRVRYSKNFPTQIFIKNR